MREYLKFTQADKQAYEARLRTASPMMFDLARKLQRAAFQDVPAASCHHSDTFTPAPIYLVQAEAILTGAVDLSDEVAVGSIVRTVREILDKVSLSDEVAAGSTVSAPTIEAAVAAARRGEA